MVSHARCTTDFDGCGQHLWVCPVGVAMVPEKVGAYDISIYRKCSSKLQLTKLLPRKLGK